VPGPRDRLGTDEPVSARSRQHGIASFPARRDPGRPAPRERDLGQRAGQRRGAAGERRGQPRDLLGERGLRAARAGALEPAHVHDNPHPAPAEREIGELALVAGVNPGRATPAARARRIACPARTRNVTRSPPCLDAVDRCRRELRQKGINAL